MPHISLIKVLTKGNVLKPDPTHNWRELGSHVIYDQVCEIEKSDWVSELKTAAEPDMRHDWVMRHFMIYIDSFGCLEVIAESVFLEDVDRI
ncbi:hypothetical protein EDD55_107204 [Varunaivibrio sulfuroxidans]|uniref:Uncharacterized protein n=1 Tax=Varunaivibrio sulfuroxidans TaxID=1773489 RepID=A0A4R3J8T6_9PROT